MNCFFDNILVFSEIEEDHEKHLKNTMANFSSAGIKLNKEKCQFCQQHIDFLGFVINKEKCPFCQQHIDFLGFVINKEKCQFCQQQIDFLGFVINKEKCQFCQQETDFLGSVSYTHLTLPTKIGV